jgi:uncharacterized protein YegL
MGKYDNVQGISKRTMTLFFIIDKSYSMAGSKIGAVNVAVREVVPEIQQIAEDSADANIKIAVLTFSTGAEWMYQSAIDSKDFKWTDLNVDGMTDMGYAFKMLNEKLSRQGGFMTESAGSYAPAIFLMSDGQPSDEYQKELNELKKNNWFKTSLKAAVAIGDDADKDMLAEFTGNMESVLTVHTPEALKKLIRFVSVTASKIGSKSSNAPVDGQEKTKQDDFNNQIVDFNNNLTDSKYDDWN